MHIRKTTKNDLATVMKIYEKARKFMAESGNPNQWNTHNWPPQSLIEEDIKNEKSYVCVNDSGNVIAIFYFDYGYKVEPCYNLIEGGSWIGEETYGVVHRIASDMSEKGIATFCLNYVFEQCGHIRIDTHEDNIPMQKLLEKLNYKKCGIIYVYDGTDPRIAYEKIKD